MRDDKPKHHATILPEVSRYENPAPINFAQHAADPSTWEAWHLALRFTYMPHGERCFVPQDIMDDGYSAMTYENAKMALLVRDGHNYPGAIAKQMGISVCESIYRISKNPLVSERNKKLVFNREQIAFTIDKLIDPRAVNVVKNEGRQCYALGGRRICEMSNKPRDKYEYESYKTWLYWYRTFMQPGSNTEDYKSMAYGYLCAHLFQYSRFCPGHATAIRYNNENSRFDIRIQYGNRPAIVSEVYLKKTIDRKTKNISLTLMRGKNKIEELTWFSDTDRLVTMFEDEYKRMRHRLEEPKKPIFNNEEICCGS